MSGGNLICKDDANTDIEIQNITPNNNKSNGIAPRPYDTQLQDNRVDIGKYSFMGFDETIETCFKKWKPRERYTLEVV